MSPPASTKWVAANIASNKRERLSKTKTVSDISGFKVYADAREMVIQRSLKDRNAAFQNAYPVRRTMNTLAA